MGQAKRRIMRPKKMKLINQNEFDLTTVRGLISDIDAGRRLMDQDVDKHQSQNASLFPYLP